MLLLFSDASNADREGHRLGKVLEAVVPLQHRDRAATPFGTSRTSHAGSICATSGASCSRVSGGTSPRQGMHSRSSSLSVSVPFGGRGEPREGARSPRPTWRETDATNRGLLRQTLSDARDDRYEVDRTWRRSGTRRQVSRLREHDLRPGCDVTDRAAVRLASSRGIAPKRRHVIERDRRHQSAHPSIAAINRGCVTDERASTLGALPCRALTTYIAGRPSGTSSRPAPLFHCN